MFRPIPTDATGTVAYFDNYVVTASSVPEPASATPLGIGLIGLLAWARRRKTARSQVARTANRSATRTLDRP